MFSLKNGGNILRRTAFLISIAGVIRLRRSDTVVNVSRAFHLER